MNYLFKYVCFGSEVAKLYRAPTETHSTNLLKSFEKFVKSPDEPALLAPSSLPAPPPPRTAGTSRIHPFHLPALNNRGV